MVLSELMRCAEFIDARNSLRNGAGGIPVAWAGSRTRTGAAKKSPVVPVDHAFETVYQYP